MTEKEAIYILRNAAWLGSDADRQKVEEAVEVVAKAIEAQDMTLHMNLPEVSAEEVVEILKRNNRIELLPPAQPEPRWIPCSERLPEKYGNYLVTTDDGEVDIGSCDPENKDRQDHFWSGCDADGFFWYGENIVLAWMSLPEEYRGEQDGNQREKNEDSYRELF